jgi:GAF domain-containing protein
VVIVHTKADGEVILTFAAHPTRPELAEAALRLTPRRIPRRIPAELQARYLAGTSLVLDPTPVELQRQGQQATRARAMLGEHRTLIAPLTVTGRTHGMLAIVYGLDPHDEHDLAMAEDFGRRIAGAMETERVAVRERRLHDVSTALAGAVHDSMGATVTSVFIANPEDPNWLRPRHVVGCPPEAVTGFSGIRMDADTAPSEAARTGAPVWVTDQPDLRDRYPDLALTGALRELHAVIALPIRIGEQLFGVLSASFDSPRAFPPDESRFVHTLVAQASQAFERAALTDARWRVSQALQESLLPTELPTLERLALAAHYQPAGRDIHAGGDWYDVIALDDVRVAIMVGDVVGNGPVAAATMGKLSSALAAYLREGHAPGKALDLLSSYAGHLGQALGSTAMCLILDTGTVETSRTLAPGASVLLYTDGLVERRREAIDDGLDRLRAAVTEHLGAGPTELLGAALTGCLPAGGPTDDVAGYLPAPLHGEIPALPEQLGVLRRAVAAWTESNGLSDDSSYDLQLALGEAVANAVEHAYRDRPAGTVTYDLALTGGRELRVRVSDQGEWRPPPADPGHRGRGLGQA